MVAGAFNKTALDSGEQVKFRQTQYSHDVLVFMAESAGMTMLEFFEAWRKAGGIPIHVVSRKRLERVKDGIVHMAERGR